MNSLGSKRPEPEEEKSIISVTVPPLARCEFCRKFDSVCSFCHFRWQKRLEENKQLLLKKFASVIVDPVTRWKILASLISQTDLRDFVGLMCRSGTVNLDILAVFEAGTHAKSLVHVAAQYNKWDMLRVLLEANAAFRRDAMDELPRIPAHIFVDNPIVAPQYERHVLMLKAHSLRQAGDHEKAIEIYVKTLESCPWYEHAWCSWIKALLEMRSYDRAWEQIIKAEHASNNGSIAWMDLDINTLVYLREECQREYHEWSHTLAPYESIKPCGCIIIPNRFRIPIKKQTIPSSVISLLVSFCECETLYYLCKALSHDKNWVTACEQGALQVDSSMTRVLSTDPHAASLRDLLIKDFRAKVGCDHLHGAVTTMVQAVADSFRAFLICVEVRLISGGEHERVRNEKFVKHFNLFRKTHDEEWSISSAGEWEATNSSAF